MTRPIRLIYLLLIVVAVYAHAPHAFADDDSNLPAPLVAGGAFRDLIRPIPVDHLESNGWGGDNVKPREAHNGIEDAKWSYWCASVIHGPDGKEHLFGSRWLESSAEGHMSWPSSRAYHAVSDLPTGPFVVKEEVGAGHNTVVYQAKDGTYVVNAIGKRYLSKSLDGPWTKSKQEFDYRGMHRVNQSNLTFTKREDGSILMVSRTGQVWISRDGLMPFMRLTSDSIYPKIEDAQYLEDPCVWRDEVQYNLIVNDWFGRRAYYARSKDGLHWKWEPGKAYDANVVRHPDGTIEGWNNLERPAVRQDDYGRATHLYLAAIDCPKDQDKASDNHSSKSVALPLTIGRRLAILNEDPLTSSTKQIRVEIKAEAGFDPQKDVDINSLVFGPPEPVNLGHGCKPVKSENSGKDLIVIFDGIGDEWAKDDFAGKLLGKTTHGELLVGYARLPGQRELEPMLLSRTPQLNTREDGTVVASVQVENFGQVKSTETSVKIVFTADKTAHSFSATVPDIAPYNSATASIVVDANALKPHTNYDAQVTMTRDRQNAEQSQTYRVVTP